MINALLTTLARLATRRGTREPTREQLEALGTISRGGYGYVDDHTGKRLVRLGLCDREWHEGLGAGFYRYTVTPAGREALQ